MNKKLALITIHGMGETAPDYWTGLKQRLEELVGPDRWEQVSFQTIFYQGLIQPNQYRAWSDMPHDRLDNMKLRKFMLFSFSDAACLEHQPHLPDSPYLKAQRIIVEAVDRARLEVSAQTTPVLLVAHSLGAQVLSNYIWDSDKNQGIWDHYDTSGLSDGQIRFLKLKTKRWLFTSGCNIPLFVSGFEDIRAIRKTPSSFQWYNFYDEDDVLGWPIKNLSESYDDVVTEDRQINAGGWLTGWNPLSHTQYWDDDNFVKPVSRAIKRALD
jgi:hypothetical protein